MTPALFILPTGQIDAMARTFVTAPPFTMELYVCDVPDIPRVVVGPVVTGSVLRIGEVVIR